MVKSLDDLQLPINFFPLRFRSKRFSKGKYCIKVLFITIFYYYFGERKELNTNLCQTTSTLNPFSD